MMKADHNLKYSVGGELYGYLMFLLCGLDDPYQWILSVPMWISLKHSRH